MKPIAAHQALLAVLLTFATTHCINAGASDLTFLKAQLRSQSIGALAQSSPDKIRFYTYDQALAIIAFTTSGDFSSAKKIARAMQSLQRQDGAWVFSYPAEPAIHDRTGANAWMLLALNQYESLSGDQTFNSTRNRAVDFLKRQIRNVSGRTVVRFSSTRDPDLTYDTTEVTSTEHLIDTIAAFESLPEKHPDRDSKLISDLRNSLKDSWIGERLVAGGNLRGEINKTETYLDTQAWAALLPWEPNEHKRIDAGLTFNCRNLRTHLGYKESLNGGQRHDENFAWLEGTHFMRVALTVRGIDSAKECATQNPQPNTSSASAGVPYSIGGMKHGLSESESIAASAWKFFADQKINPMQVPKKSVISSL